jgi:hypothetical protein
MPGAIQVYVQSAVQTDITEELLSECEIGRGV